MPEGIKNLGIESANVTMDFWGTSATGQNTAREFVPAYENTPSHRAIKVLDERVILFSFSDHVIIGTEAKIRCRFGQSKDPPISTSGVPDILMTWKVR